MSPAGFIICCLWTYRFTLVYITAFPLIKSVPRLGAKIHIYLSTTDAKVKGSKMQIILSVFIGLFNIPNVDHFLILQKNNFVIVSLVLLSFSRHWLNSIKWLMHNLICLLEKYKPDTDETVQEAVCDVCEILILSFISKIGHEDFSSLPS